MNKLLIISSVILTLPLALLDADEIEERTEHETYIWLEREGIFDSDVPNDKVYDLLTNGIEHEDPTIVHCAISAIVLYTAMTTTLRTEYGESHQTDRQLGKIPGLYDLLIGLWEDGWKKAGEKVPEAQYPADHNERMMKKTGCIAPDPVWTSLSLPMATLFPGDEKVHDIIWKDLPNVSKVSLLAGLYEGKFNYPKDQKFRIDLLTNPATNLYTTRLVAKSLGDFRADRGLEALVSVLKERSMDWVALELEIVQAMMKYEEEAVPYISLMRERLEKNTGFSEDVEVRDTLRERLAQFEETYAEKETPLDD